MRVLGLRRNLGHQRAIAVGLAYIREQTPCDCVVVMDADGEDRPSDVPALLAHMDREGRGKIVFAARHRRSDGIVFRLFYFAYRLIHRALTGVAVRVGNFSAVPASCLDSLVVVSETWNHYAAAVFRSRIPYTSIPVVRGMRIAGKSHMDFVSLVTHGLSAMAVFGDTVAVRLLILAGLLVAGLVVAAIGAAGSVDEGTAHWLGVAFVILCQFVAALFSLAFSVLWTRAGAGFLPIRDYGWFTRDVRTVHGPDD
jgi:glycosyltransferase involved in cell wall biosynthesis